MAFMTRISVIRWILSVDKKNAQCSSSVGWYHDVRCSSCNSSCSRESHRLKRIHLRKFNFSSHGFHFLRLDRLLLVLGSWSNKACLFGDGNCDDALRRLSCFFAIDSHSSLSTGAGRLLKIAWSILTSMLILSLSELVAEGKSRFKCVMSYRVKGCLALAREYDFDSPRLMQMQILHSTNHLATDNMNNFVEGSWQRSPHAGDVFCSLLVWKNRSFPCIVYCCLLLALLRRRVLLLLTIYNVSLYNLHFIGTSYQLRWPSGRFFESIIISLV